MHARTHLLAASSHELGVWLNAPPCSSLGLRMDDSTMRVAVGLRLGCSLCKPHHCHHCGAAVDPCTTHGLSCKQSDGLHYRHSSLNAIIYLVPSVAKIPSCLEPEGVFGSDSKRSDGITLVPWERSKLMVWDATCTDTISPSYLARTTNKSGAVAAMVETRKKGKYATMDPSHSFQLIAVQTTGVFGPETLSFISELGHRICQIYGEKISFSFLLQHLAVAIQRGNSTYVSCKYIYFFIFVLFVCFSLVIALYCIILFIIH